MNLLGKPIDQRPALRADGGDALGDAVEVVSESNWRYFGVS
ncbi:MAG: hypothetical protein WDA15_10885 [Trueperaceae bacterium]